MNSTDTTAELLENRKTEASAWFEDLRNQICKAFEDLEDELTGTNADQEPGRFERKTWQRPDQVGETGGGGTMSIMRGRVFEKVGVNISTVHGTFSEQFRKEIPGAEESEGKFWASGLSLVAHMHSPLVPAIHMNTRFIVTSKSWFGGGTDLNPMYEIEAETQEFHDVLKATCDKYDPAYYPKYKEWCDDYFMIKHWNEPRGVGGIFFDYLDSGDWQTDFNFTQDVGRAFLDIYPRLVARHMNENWTEEQREWQLIKRGRYAEFNLVYDRGTRFGLMTGGNPEAVLMSLPPEARWP
ncbi:oxygen-dependent coproporphyrinogen oxidase [Aestuariispira insulae]|uniref:coproporphyrinogen oxidase n=1 Tax=Aestuariispira insulae TaxID=1461337 RepID=A0A3D9HGV5_9PROT|nr:oxygen-dependent coproporphyrinogen oxidase [Aestuariispira insulae]RED48635.1 coproporphyrinogen oxidase [Aestuariispira insulae]